jgi:monofunctional biosynthetic peptidoglycan transglycosylase
MVGVRWWLRALPAAVFWLLAYVYLTTPDVRPLAARNPTTTAFMTLRAAEARDEAREIRRVHRWVSYTRISTNLKRAVLVAEDSAFWQHDGLDYEQIRESMEVNLERLELARGASTITQQLAKNLYLSPSKNPLRKVRELLITRRLEAVLTKRRILELYLNVIEWGDGIWGAEAAARAYFRKPAASLGPEEAALLAGAIINPRVLNPERPTPRLLRRQRLVLRRMGRATPPSDAVTTTASPSSTAGQQDERATSELISDDAGPAAQPGAASPTTVPVKTGEPHDGPTDKRE